MQTFSYLQRSGYDDRSSLIRSVLAALILFLYEPLTTINPYLPPFIALAFWRIVKSQNVNERFLWIAYIYLFEVDHALPTLFLFFSFLFAYYMLQKSAQIILCVTCQKFIATTAVYLSLLLAIYLFNYIFQEGISLQMWLVGYYFLIDLLLVVFYES